MFKTYSVKSIINYVTDRLTNYFHANTSVETRNALDRVNIAYFID